MSSTQLTLKYENRVVAKHDNRWVNEVNAFGNEQDPITRTRFIGNQRLTYQEIDSLFRHNWLARSIVTSLPEDATREWIQFDIKDNDQDHLELLEEKLEELDIRFKYYEAILLARLYGGSVLVLGAYDGQDLAQPLNPSNIEWFGFLLALDRYQCWPYIWYSDPTSPKFGLPSHYLIQPLGYAATLNRFLIHETRLIRFDGNYLPIRERLQNLGWMDSILEVVYEAIRQYGISAQAGASILQDFIVKVFSMNDLEDKLSADQEALVMQRMRMMAAQMGSNNIALIGPEDTLTKIGTPVQGLEALMEQFVNYACAAAQIPKSRLFGNLSGVLGANAAGIDLRNWYDRVRVYQQNQLINPLRKIIKLVEIANKFQLQYKVVWRPLWQFDEQTRATIYSQTAQADIAYIDRGVLDPSEVRNSRFRGRGIDLDNIIIDQKTRDKVGLTNEVELEAYKKELEFSTDPRKLQRVEEVV